MSRQPPGGTSTICFGTDSSPFKKDNNGAKPAESPLNMSGAFSSASMGGGLSATQKAEALTTSMPQIRGLIDEAESVDELVNKLAELFATPKPAGDTVGTDTQTPTHTSTMRGFKPATQKVESAIDHLKDALKRRGVDSLARLAKKFKIMDDNNSRSLCYDELKKGMLESGCKLEECDMQALFRFLDADCSGQVSIDEFFLGVRGEMNARRAAMVQKAFEVLDVNHDGALTVTDLSGQYDCSRHPDVVAGAATDVEVLQNFLSGFDGTMGATTKIVTPEKFAAYYAGVSASVDDDDYFELMIRNVWHIGGGEGVYALHSLAAALPTTSRLLWPSLHVMMSSVISRRFAQMVLCSLFHPGGCENTTCRRLLVTHDDGSQSIEVLQDDIDVSKEDLQEMKKRLVEQGVPVVKIALYGDLTDGDATTSSPRKKTNPMLEKEEDVVVASAYKQRMAQSSVTF